MADTDTLPRGRFVILNWDVAQANFATVEEAISLAQREQVKQPTTRFAVLQLVALIEPTTVSKVTFHRF